VALKALEWFSRFKDDEGMLAATAPAAKREYSPVNPRGIIQVAGKTASQPRHGA
jgi:hypothetical protein